MMKNIFGALIILLNLTSAGFSLFYEDGLNSLESQNYKEALNLFEKSLAKKELEEYKIRYYIGQCYYYMNETEKAIKNFERSISLKSNWYLPYHDLGLIYFEKKNNLKLAEKYFNKAIFFNPLFGLGYYNLGNLYLKMNEPGKAIKMYEKSLALIKENNILSKVYLGLGNAYDILNNYAEAIIYYKKSVELDSKNLKSYLNMGLVFFKQDLYDEAIENFKNVINLDKGNYIAYFYLGNCFRAQKKFKEMEKNYIKSFEINPNYADVCYSLASYYAISGKKDLMLKYLKALFSIDKQYINIILKDNLFENYKEDEELKKLIREQGG